jgi:hypothetical protein
MFDDLSLPLVSGSQTNAEQHFERNGLAANFRRLEHPVAERLDQR